MIFLPKFHCEINYIEYLWGFSKRIVRARYPKTLDELKLLVSQSLAACDVSTIRRWERRMWKFIDLYSCDKMTGPLAAYAIKMYRGHRRIPASIADEIDKLELQRLEASADPRTIAAATLMDEGCAVGVL